MTFENLTSIRPRIPVQNFHNDVPWLTTENGKAIEYEAVFYRTPAYSVREYDDAD